MFCTKCGGEYNDSSAFCPNCGNPTQQSNASAQQSYAQPTQQMNYAPQMNNQSFNQGFNPMMLVSQFINEAKTAHTLSIVSIIAAFFMPIAGLICGIIASSKAKKLPMINDAELDDMMRFQYQDAKNKAESAKKLGTAGWILSIVVWIGSILIGIIAGVFMATASSSVMYY